jgi:hypothetical protein
MSNDNKRYLDAAHAMQTGVAFLMNSPEDDSKETEPKHLRVGINAAMADQDGLVTLLIEKGVFTQEEYLEAVADSMERERDLYQQRVDNLYPGKTIKLV